MRIFTEFMSSPKPEVPEQWWGWRGSVNGVGYYRWIPRGKSNTLTSIGLPKHDDVVRAAHSQHAAEYFGNELVRRFLESTVYKNSRGFFVNSTATKKQGGVPLTGLDVIDSWMRNPDLWDDVLKMYSVPVDGQPYILHQNGTSRVVTGNQTSVISALLFDTPDTAVSHMTLSLLSANTLYTGMDESIRLSGASYTEYSRFFHSESTTNERLFYIIPTRVAERRVVFAQASVDPEYALLWASITVETEDDAEALNIVRMLDGVPMSDVLHMKRMGISLETIAATWGKGIDNDLLVSLSVGVL